MVFNVGERGVFLTSREHFPVATKVMLFLPLEMTRQQDLCMLQGTIVWVEAPGRHAEYGYGIHFDSPSPGAATLLRRFVELRSRKDLKNYL